MVLASAAVAIASALSLVVAQTTTTTTTATSSAWSFRTVRSVQARVQADAPVWDAEHGAWVAVFPQNTETFEQQYRAAMDTVNTATVEGCLFYVQSEGIDKQVQAQNNCMRKSNMSFVWFYDVEIVQPALAVAQFGADTGVVPEYGPFTAMDNGMCTPTSGTAVPQTCMQFTGLDGNVALGPYVGGEPRPTHQYADYANNYWFSYPGSCFTRSFAAKTDACRDSSAQKGGLCPFGTKPDGTNCTFSYSILGFVSIDDVVGITAMTSTQTGKLYANHVEFCKDGKYEWDFSTSTGIPFWADPLNATANAARSQKLMDWYTTKVAAGTGAYANMKPFPKVQDLVDANPSCSDNSPLCAKQPHGCQRTLLGQICAPCAADGANCKPATRPFPSLPVATTTPPVTDTAGNIVPTVTNALGQSVPATANAATAWLGPAAVSLFLALNN